MPNDDMRKVIRTLNPDNEETDIELSDIELEYLETRSSRKKLVAIVVLLVALLLGLVAVLVMITKPLSRVVVDGSLGAMTWEQSIYGTGKENLVAPTSVAVSPAGEIYVAEPQKSRIVIFNSDGSFNRTIESSTQPTRTPEGTSEMPTASATPSEEVTKTRAFMPRPESVYVDSRGMLYVADPVRGAVFEFDKTDEPVRTIPLGEPAYGVASSDTELFVLGEGRVYVFPKGGGTNYTRWFGGLGNYPGEINAYQGIEVYKGAVYIADSYNHRIEAFTTQGEFLWASPAGTASTEATSSVWSLPQDLTVDAADHLVIIDALNFEISQASVTNGSFIGAWGEYGSADGQFSYPSSVAYDEQHDRFVVADTKNNRVQIVKLPNSSKGLGGLFNTVKVSPWRYILIPLFFVLLLVAIVYVIRKIYVRRKRKNDFEEMAVESPDLDDEEKLPTAVASSEYKDDSDPTEILGEDE